MSFYNNQIKNVLIRFPMFLIDLLSIIYNNIETEKYHVMLYNLKVKGEANTCVT